MNNRGQSMMEYALIAVLVILGVVVMGPYVLRSINAHFKLWDEGVEDSFTENIKQASVNDVPDIDLTCKCTDSPGKCGGACGANQKTITHTCSLPGCDGRPTSYCVDDLGCCTDWTSVRCGDVRCPDTGCAGLPSSLGVDCASPPTPPSPPMPASNNCYYGQDLQTRLRGSTTEYQCISNPRCPLPACKGDTAGATACTGSPGTCPPPGCPSLLQDEDVNFVADVGKCDTSSKTPCQYYCATGYVLNATGTACEKPTMCGVSCGTSCSSGQLFSNPKLCDGSIYAGHGEGGGGCGGGGSECTGIQGAYVFCHMQGFAAADISRSCLTGGGTFILGDYTGPSCGIDCTCPGSTQCVASCKPIGTVGCSKCRIWTAIYCHN